MKRILASLASLSLSAAVYAQSTPEPPTEKADMFTVAIFILLFVAACVAYGVYLWWGQRKQAAANDAKRV
jgi:hypothetical protein